LQKYKTIMLNFVKKMLKKFAFLKNFDIKDLPERS